MRSALLRLARPAIFTLPLALLSPSQLPAQSGTPAPMTPLASRDPRIDKITEAMHKSKSPTWVSLSPDGQNVAWTLRRSEGTQIHITPVANPTSDIVLQVPGPTGCSSETPVWSPDGKSLAFTSTCTPKSEKAGQEQIFLWTNATGKSRQLTHLTGNIDSLAFSPDGKSIAFLFVENATRSAGALAAMKPWSGVIGEDGVEIQRVGAVHTANGNFAFLTPPELHVYEFDWSPDSHELAFIAANPPGENNWWVAKLYTKRNLPIGYSHEDRFAAGGLEGLAEVVLDPTAVSGPLHGLQIAVPRFSPDGSQIAFIGGIMSDQGSTGGDIYTIPSQPDQGRQIVPTDITANIDGSPTYLSWISDHTVSFVEDRRGHTLLSAINVNTKSIVPGAPVDLGEVSVRGGSLKDSIGLSNRVDDHKNRVAAFIQSSFNSPPEVWAGTPGSLKQITHLNDGVKPVWGKSESVEWENEGFHIQGWLMYPVDYNPAKKYPLIVSVHGGPSSAVGSSWGAGGALFSAMNYFIFSPNPRGSYGQGERFTQANVKDFGYGDLRDILKGMDTLEAKYPIDKNREGLTGWSYGGFMTMFGVTQTTRFKAAVAGAGISDWKSYYGENSIDQWMLPFFGKTVYDDPAVYAKSSAIEYIDKVKTPTLVIVGDRDGECPAPQSFEFWHALRAEGVKTQLVVYPNEGHGFVDSSHVRDRNERMLNWFATEMP